MHPAKMHPAKMYAVILSASAMVSAGCGHESVENGSLKLAGLPDPAPVEVGDQPPANKPPADEPPSDKPVATKDSPIERQAGESTVRDWPNWMGPNHDGVSTETGWSDHWPNDGLAVCWTQQIGIGFSSVSIVDGKLYTMGHAAGKETVFCLDLETGEPGWTHSYESPLVKNLHEGGPGATPTVHGDFVFTLGKGGRLICFRRDGGKVVWSTELQEDLGVSLPEWGFNGSPLILDEMLILEGGRVVAYNKKTGKKIWQTEKHRAGYGSAAVFRQAGRTMLTTLDCDGLRLMQAVDGAEVAFFPWDSPFNTNSTTPIIIDGKIFISAGYNVGCGLLELKGGELELVYSNRDMRNHFNNSILFEGYLYGFDGNSNRGRTVHLKCMDAATGKILWQKHGFGCGSLMIANGRLVVLAENGELVLASATEKGYDELARSAFLEGRCWTVPVLHGGRIYGRNANGKLVCAQLPRE